jgi:hypothetical protein
MNRRGFLGSLIGTPLAAAMPAPPAIEYCTDDEEPIPDLHVVEMDMRDFSVGKAMPLAVYLQKSNGPGWGE